MKGPSAPTTDQRVPGAGCRVPSARAQGNESEQGGRKRNAEQNHGTFGHKEKRDAQSRQTTEYHDYANQQSASSVGEAVAPEAVERGGIDGDVHDGRPITLDCRPHGIADFVDRVDPVASGPVGLGNLVERRA